MTDTYSFVSAAARAEHRARMEASGVTYAFEETTETVGSRKTKGLTTTLYVLKAVRTSPTLKQRLNGLYTGD